MSIKEKKPRVLIISGIDPTGAAGFILDVSIATKEKVEVAGVPTCLVAENFREVKGIQASNADIFLNSLELILEEGNFKATKIGLISQKVLKPFLSFIKNNRSHLGYIVFDPVIQATSGAILYSGKIKEILKLTNEVDLITPNLEEFKSIFKPKTPFSFKQLADLKKTIRSEILITSYKKTDRFITNLLITEGGLKQFKTRVYPYEVRGTGCALSTLVAVHKAKGYPLEEAVKISMKKLSAMIEKAKLIKDEKRRLFF